MAILTKGIGDDLTMGEVNRLLAENVALRSRAKEVARRLCYLEKLLMARSDSSLQFKERTKGIDIGKFELKTSFNGFLANDILRLADENSWLRSEISLAEIEIFQIELTIESMQYLLDVNTESKIARVDAKEHAGPSTSILLHTDDLKNTRPRNKNESSSFSETSEGEFPKIKAVFGGNSGSPIHGGACNSSRRSRSRAQSNASSVSWCSNPPKSNPRPRVSKPSDRKSPSKNSAPFMGCQRSINVDSSSAVFFASLRS